MSIPSPHSPGLCGCSGRAILGPRFQECSGIWGLVHLPSGIPWNILCPTGHSLLFHADPCWVVSCSQMQSHMAFSSLKRLLKSSRGHRGHSAVGPFWAVGNSLNLSKVSPCQCHSHTQRNLSQSWVSSECGRMPRLLKTWTSSCSQILLFHQTRLKTTEGLLFLCTLQSCIFSALAASLGYTKKEISGLSVLGNHKLI